MKIFFLAILMTYAALLFFSNLCLLVQHKIPRKYPLVFSASTLILLLSIYYQNLWLLALILTLISITSWFMAPQITPTRHLAHHLVRAFFHLGLLMIATILWQFS